MKPPKPKTSFGTKGAIPTGAPKSQQIGKCEKCGFFRRLADLEGDKCVKCSPAGYTINEPCRVCDDWTDKKELEIHDGLCENCHIERGAE